MLNPEFLPFAGGETKTLAEMADWLRRATDDVEGITLLGGEPFAHAESAAALAQYARDLGLSVMVFSGFTLDQIYHAERDDYIQLLALTDILVDGPYLREQPDTARRWVGSTNQRIHFLTDRYCFDERWQQRDRLHCFHQADNRGEIHRRRRPDGQGLVELG